MRITLSATRRATAVVLPLLLAGLLATTARATATDRSGPRAAQPTGPAWSGPSMSPASWSSSPQTRVALARAFYEVVDARPFDAAAVRSYFTPGFVDRNRPRGFDGLTDRDTIVTLLDGLAAAFPDGRHHLERVEPVGRDEVLVYWRFTGTHTGAPFLGVPAAGAAVDFVGTDLFRVQRGRLTEQRHVEDLLTLIGQLQAPAS